MAVNQQADSNYVSCPGCQTMLCYPNNSTTIQCPRCAVIMEVAPQPQPMMAIPSNPPTAPARKPKKRRDPNAPKRAMNAYMIFCKERRPDLKKKFPDLPFGKIGAKLGDMWRNFNAEEKKPYEERASNDRERFKKEMENYVDSTGVKKKEEE